MSSKSKTVKTDLRNAGGLPAAVITAEDPNKEEKKIPFLKRKMQPANLPGPKIRMNGATRIEKGDKLPRLKRK